MDENRSTEYELAPGPLRRKSVQCRTEAAATLPPLSRGQLIWVALEIGDWRQVPGVSEALRTQWAAFVTLNVERYLERTKVQEEYEADLLAGKPVRPLPPPAVTSNPWPGVWEPLLLFQYGLLVAIHDECIDDVNSHRYGKAQRIVTVSEEDKSSGHAWALMAYCHVHRDELEQDVVAMALDAVHGDLIGRGFAVEQSPSAADGAAPAGSAVCKQRFKFSNQIFNFMVANGGPIATAGVPADNGQPADRKTAGDPKAHQTPPCVRRDDKAPSSSKCNTAALPEDFSGSAVAETFAWPVVE